MAKRALDFAFAKRCIRRRSQLSLEQSADNDKVKKNILKAYELIPEAYRQKLRDCRKELDQTHVEFA